MSEHVAADVSAAGSEPQVRQSKATPADHARDAANADASRATLAAPVTIPISSPGEVPEITQPASTQFVELADHTRAATTEILDKQYRLYTWNDAKTQALITTNSIMFAAIGYMFKECMRDSLAMLFLTSAIICLGVSLTTSLLQVIPRVSSGRSGAGPNVRSIRGISLYNTWEDYYSALTAQTSRTLTVDAVRQVYGMALNNIRSTRIIKRGVILTISATMMLLGAIFASAVSARGTHVLGEWQRSASSSSVPGASAAATPLASPPSVSTPPTQATPKRAVSNNKP